MASRKISPIAKMNKSFSNTDSVTACLYPCIHHVATSTAIHSNIATLAFLVISRGFSMQFFRVIRAATARGYCQCVAYDVPRCLHSI